MRSLRLSQQQVQTIVEHCIHTLPDEACGLIAGYGELAESIIPINNASENPKRHYRMDANEQLKALKLIDSENLDWIAVFHSHPDSAPIPSQEDIRVAELNTPGIIHLIVSLKHNKSRLQAWHIHDGQVDEVELLIGQKRSEAVKALSRLEIWAVLVAILIAVALLLAISFSLLPPAPPLPTP